MKHILCTLSALAMCMCAQSAHGKVELPAVFSDRMVIQQGQPVRVWGKADPGERVTASLAGQTVAVAANGEGRFRIELPPMDAKTQPGPYELVVSGSNTIKCRDVLVGEVWLCSGQSNMRFALRGCANAQQEIAAAKFDRIRLFWVPDADSVQPQFSMNAKWRACSPQSVADFSGAAYYFGRELHRALDVPVGLVESSRGWSPAEAWLPNEVLAANPLTKPIIDRQQTLNPRLDELEKDYQQKLATWRAEQRAATQQASRPATSQPTRPRPRRVWGVDPRLRPEGCYNAMLAPLAPLPLAGVVWYQGESNALRAEQYRTMLPMLIAHWRQIFQRPDLPFGIVQLTNHVNREIPFDGSWAELREAQLITHRAVAHTGLAVTIDVGEPYNIHPLNKQDVGKRLAAWALREVYKRPGQPISPLFKSAAIEGNQVRIRFDHAASGLQARGGSLAGFVIAGADRRFVPADARIDGAEVIVSSPQVPSPLAVRYAWSDSPVCSLYGADGAPASPFRTDDWPLLTAGVKTDEWQ